MEGLPVNRGLNQQKRPIFDIIEPSIVRTQFNLAKPKPTLRDASFSAYLQPNDPITPTKHRADDLEISIFEAEKYFSEIHDQKGTSSKSADLSSIPMVSSVSSVDDGHGRNNRARSFHATPTASSEASWNSQTGLLSNSAAVSIRNLPNSDEKNNKSLKWFLRCNCPCSGKKSVQVKDTNSESKIQQIPQLNRSNSSGSSLYSCNRQSSPRYSAYARKAITITSLSHDQDNRRNLMACPQLDQTMIINPNSNLSGFSSKRCFPPNHTLASGRSFADTNGTASNGFTFPILSNSTPTGNRMFSVVPPVSGAAGEDPPRDSLEVFQPREPPHRGGRERQSLTFPASPKSRRASYDEEIGSDASSDLFEIESFSTQTTSYPRRDSSDENSSFNARRLVIGPVNEGQNSQQILDEPMTPSVAPTDYYPPSEVSIDWSVTTAEGFDRASLTNFSIAAASECEYVPARRDGEKSEKIADGGGSGAEDGGGSRRRGNGLLGCRCEKAVSVEPGPTKCAVEGSRAGPVLPASTVMKPVGGRAAVAPPIVGRPPLGRARPSFTSVPPAMQGR
ncbi:hypothetical protein Nepgr_009924 [Nepenthes gracilis]|uniref:Uncharacterized protein n=1 Tax=Nepenthes gracilis TaxID=150966 RepID=A0AAD3XKT7_NEPGR|nr:hypothetical protein Nepgr_009924 [Nepenthes gracilis]